MITPPWTPTPPGNSTSSSDPTWNLYQEMWQPALLRIAEMESRGIGFDVGKCATLNAQATQDKQALEEEWELFAPGVNPASPKQLTEFLYRTKGAPLPPICGTLNAVKRRDPDSEPTSEAALHWLATNSKQLANARGLRCLLALKKVTRLVQFMDKLPEHVVNGRIYASFGPNTETARLNCRNPNLQQIPSRDDKYGIRSCFVPAIGSKLIVSDFEQLELYVLAHFLEKLFGDESLKKALLDGDVYTNVAHEAWPETRDYPNLKFCDVHAVKRRRADAKIIVLGKNYGKTVNGLAVQLGVSKAEAAEFDAAYGRAFPGVAKFQAWAASYALTWGHTRTILGRRRQIEGIDSEIPGIRARAARQAANGIIQGSAADIVMQSLLAFTGNTVLQVHDELVAEAPISQVQLVAAELERAMETSIPLRCPLKAEVKIVDNWGEAKS